MYSITTLRQATGWMKPFTHTQFREQTNQPIYVVQIPNKFFTAFGKKSLFLWGKGNRNVSLRRIHKRLLTVIFYFIYFDSHIPFYSKLLWKLIENQHNLVFSTFSCCCYVPQLYFDIFSKVFSIQKICRAILESLQLL